MLTQHMIGTGENRASTDLTSYLCPHDGADATRRARIEGGSRFERAWMMIKPQTSWSEHYRCVPHSQQPCSIQIRRRSFAMAGIDQRCTKIGTCTRHLFLSFHLCQNHLPFQKPCQRNLQAPRRVWSLTRWYSSISRVILGARRWTFP